MAAASLMLGGPAPSPNWLHSARSLYDMDYVNGGCQGDPPEGTAVDDALGTYATNYLVFAIGLAAAVASALNSRAAAPYRLMASVFFGLTGAGYALAGLLHQFLHEDEEVQEHAVPWGASFILVLLGSLSLNLLINELLFANFDKIGDCGRKTAHTLAVLLSGGAILTVAVGRLNLFLTGAATGIVLLYALIAYVTLCRWVSALAVTCMIAGLLVQVGLTPSCGHGGYVDCWVHCPLPAPHFNQSALFHVLYAIGLLTLAIVMPLLPPSPASYGNIHRLPLPSWLGARV
eukprot:CAMPEP_0204522378 /NCGR_PEP_ID=MMETSP0661-20131031/6291_1 /ASSEMBLY_ACC=CAM_ASM_000606 /TAXON_ID=109239 /ORGANISM="Alexandrium margalefi, Strain AMGDE01CS-322" /LENGTH=288 /DNA_ID=CAMNT_0051528041 /DNA_START=45 /DNA_END=911 /DNA_ORIENTATION=-